MRGRNLTPEKLQEVYAALREGGKTVNKIAEDLGVHRATVSLHRQRMIEAGVAAVTAEGEPEQQPEEEQPKERHDSAFWRRKAAAAAKDIDALHALVQELSAVNGLTLRKPDWALPGKVHGKHSRSTLVVHNSDRHLGEVIDPVEINGWNSYNVEICQRRVQRLISTAIEKGLGWVDSQDEIDGVLYTMGGDEISGDIHDELRETNEVTSLDQVRLAVELHVWCISELLEAFDRVHVLAVPGNHGRTTRKPTAKRYGALSYDIMIAKLVAREFEDDERVSFRIADGPDAMAIIYNRPVLLTHGDKIGTGGGQGFAGPSLPIARGTKKVREQYASVSVPPYLILNGHYHTSMALPGVLNNGSVPGYSEYGFGIRSAYDTPKQWIALLRESWGLSEMLAVQLERPVMPDKPRIRPMIGA